VAVAFALPVQNVAATAAAASTHTVQPATSTSGHLRGEMLMRGGSGGRQEPRVCAGCNPPLTPGPGPVMGSAQTTGEVTITPIYWAPGGTAFPASYQQLTTRYINDVAGASGSNTNVYAINTEYYQTVNGQKSFIQYKIHAGAPVVDTTTPYPSPGCAVSPGFQACVSDEALRAEIAANAPAAGLDHLYMIFTPPSVESRDNTGASNVANYCGYHSNFDVPAGTLVYANEPYPPEQGCDGGQAPNGDSAADSQISTMSHEIDESITDPLLNAWVDFAGNENGDQCNFIFGVPTGSTDPANPTTTRYNQVINGNKYYTQESFSNKDFAAGRGCAQMEVGTPPSAHNGVTVSASPSTLPADGSSTATVSVTVKNSTGTAVPGDDVTFTSAAVGSSADCGTLSPDRATTDSSGNAAVTYTAGIENVTCYLVVEEGVGGEAGTTSITQGVMNSYWLVASDGGIFPFGNAAGLGSTGNIRLNRPIVGMAGAPNGEGYWLVASDGGIFPFGNAGGFGSTGNIRLNKPIVGMAATPDGGGYWLVASDGGIFPFGDAGGFGSTGGMRLNKPIVAMAATSDGQGYWLVASDGGIFPFGDAPGLGSTGGMRLNQPIVGMAAAPNDGGYWLVASDGGIFPFGMALGLGSTGSTRLNQPIVGMAATRDGQGYWLVARDGGIFPFGDAPGLGSTGNIRLNQPIVGMAGS
jgi:hypothetical protein